ncbi:MAG: hypothetical protein IAE95_03725 [Chitinophagaceae bacterium]|nr:hypothetical protein [Chitinophagaceae bacterium]
MIIKVLALKTAVSGDGNSIFTNRPDNKYCTWATDPSTTVSNTPMFFCSYKGDLVAQLVQQPCFPTILNNKKNN